LNVLPRSQTHNSPAQHRFQLNFWHRFWLVRGPQQRACFIVKDANGLAVAYVYYEEEPGRRAAANLMNKDEARRIAANIVKLPGLLGKYAPR